MDIQCLSGHCYSNICDVEKKANGEACSSDKQCASGYCAKEDLCDDKPTAEQITAMLNSMCSDGETICVDDTHIATCKTWETGNAAFMTNACTKGSTCMKVNKNVDCYTLCSESEAGKQSKLCDPEWLDDEGYSTGYFLYECKAVDGIYIQAYMSNKACGYNEMCWPFKADHTPAISASDEVAYYDCW